MTRCGRGSMNSVVDHATERRVAVSPDTTKPPGGGFAPTTVDPLRAETQPCRNDPGGGYCEGRRRRNGELHVITSFSRLMGPQPRTAQASGKPRLSMTSAEVLQSRAEGVSQDAGAAQLKEWRPEEFA